MEVVDREIKEYIQALHGTKKELSAWFSSQASEQETGSAMTQREWLAHAVIASLASCFVSLVLSLWKIVIRVESLGE
jgi:hypothetical protein